MIACSCLASALLAVGGMTNGVQIARTPVTNAEFTTATGHKTPGYWGGRACPQGRERHSVLAVSYSDVLAFCE